MPLKKISNIILLLCSFIFFGDTIVAQNKKGLVGGPWAGNVELRNATIWLEVSKDVKSVAVKFSSINADKNSSGIDTGTVFYKNELGKDFNPLKIELNGLKVG